MIRFAVDTNVVIRAFRARGAREDLFDFVARWTDRVFLHGVVALELRAGAIATSQLAAVEELQAAFIGGGQTFSASFTSYREAGRVLADLVRRERRSVAATPSLFRDAVLAASCREHRLTLVTENHADFAAIARHLRGFRFAAPFP